MSSMQIKFTPVAPRQRHAPAMRSPEAEGQFTMPRDDPRPGRKMVRSAALFKPEQVVIEERGRQVEIITDLIDLGQ